MPATGFTGTLAVMALSLLAGLLSGLAESLTDFLTALNQHLTPVTASLLGTVVVGGLSVGARELFAHLRWRADRRSKPEGG